MPNVASSVCLTTYFQRKQNTSEWKLFSAFLGLFLLGKQHKVFLCNHQVAFGGSDAVQFVRFAESKRICQPTLASHFAITLWFTFV